MIENALAYLSNISSAEFEVHILDFSNIGKTGNPTREVLYAFQKDIDGVLDSCSFAFCAPDHITRAAVQYGTIRWLGLLDEVTEHLLIVAYHGPARNAAYERAFSNLVSSVVESKKPVVIDESGYVEESGHITPTVFEEIFDTEDGTNIYYMMKPARIKKIPSVVDTRHVECLRALKLNTDVFAIKTLLSPYRAIKEMDAADLVKTLTFGKVDIGDLDALKEVPNWILPYVAVTASAIEGAREESETFNAIAKVWHDTLLSNNVSPMFAFDVLGNSVNTEVFLDEVHRIGVEHAVDAVLAGVPLEDILV